MMPTSETGIYVKLFYILRTSNQKSEKHVITQAGFTLIELLTVIVLIAIVAGFSAISLSNDPKRIIETFSKQFTQKFELLSEEAALNGKDYGLLIEEESYRYLEWDQITWRVPTDLLVAEAIPYPDNLSVTLFLEEESVLSLESEAALTSDEDADDETEELATPPQVLLLSSGEITPFTLQMETNNSDELIEIKIDTLGRSSVERQN